VQGMLVRSCGVVPMRLACSSEGLATAACSRMFTKMAALYRLCV